MPRELIFDKGCLFDVETGLVISPRVVLNTAKYTRPLLYISGPMYSEGLLIDNVRLSVEVATEAYAKGWAPVLPQLDFIVPLINGDWRRERYMDCDLSLVAISNAVCVLPFKIEKLPNGTIPGTVEELEFADYRGVPVFTRETLPTIVRLELTKEIV